MAFLSTISRSDRAPFDRLEASLAEGNDISRNQNVGVALNSICGVLGVQTGGWHGQGTRVQRKRS
jgi:hypothetical protein